MSVEKCSDTGAAITRALAFLQRRQLTHGEFATQLGADRTMSGHVFDSACFATTHVLYSLSVTEDERAKPMIDRAANFLISEQGWGGLWRYWSSHNHKHGRLGPDLDDTACASDALRHAGFDAPRNLWAFRRSRDSAGRFYTWVLPKRLNRFDAFGRFALGMEERQARRRTGRVAVPDNEDPRFVIMHIDEEDIDPVVNANVVLYLGERRETEAAIDFVSDTIRYGSSKPSLYYEDTLALYYAVARSRDRGFPRLSALGPVIVAQLTTRLSGGENFDPLRTALAAVVLSIFAPDDARIPGLVYSLAQTQLPHGGWNACAFYNVWGSEELTTGFALEALTRARRLGLEPTG